MPLIDFPNVPELPGVPQIKRLFPGSNAIKITLAQGSGHQSPSTLPTWGIFVSGNGRRDPFFPPNRGTLSFFSLGLDADSAVSDFPTEAPNSVSAAQFASFNKVYIPIRPTVTLSFAGTDSEKQDFLSTLELAKESTPLYDIYTPDANYIGYAMSGYRYQRSATRGASLLMVEIAFTQIRQVTAAYSNTPIKSPQSPSAQKSVSNGIVQPVPPTSILYKAFGAF